MEEGVFVVEGGERLKDVHRLSIYVGSQCVL